MTSFSSSKNRRNHRGMTLVELAVVVAAVSVIMSTVAVSLHRMYRADRSVRDELAESATLMRLSSMFRADAHAAIGVVKSDAAVNDLDGAGLRLRLRGNETIEYTFTNNSIRRTKRRGDEVVHRDSFRLASDVDVELVFRDEQAAQMASIIVRRRPSVASSTGPWYRIDAAVGLDHSNSTEHRPGINFMDFGGWWLSPRSPSTPPAWGFADSANSHPPLARLGSYFLDDPEEK